MTTLERFTGCIEDLVSSIGKGETDVRRIKFEEFEESLCCLSEAEFDYTPVFAIGKAIDDLFEIASKTPGTSIGGYFSDIMMVLISNACIKRYVPKIINYWPMVYCLDPSRVNEFVLRELMDDSVQSTSSSWLSSLLLVKVTKQHNYTIDNGTIPPGFCERLQRILLSNQDFTTVNYLLELNQSLAKSSVSKDISIESISISITQKPKFLRETPNVNAGSYETLSYLNKVNRIFRNLYQLSYIRSLSLETKSFENGDLIFLQIIDKVMVLWFTNRGKLDPVFINLNNLRSINILDGDLIKLIFKQRQESWNSYSMLSNNSKIKNVVFEIRLKRRDLSNSLIGIFNRIINISNKKVSVVNSFLSLNSQEKELEAKQDSQFSLTSGSQLSDIDSDVANKLNSYLKECSSNLYSTSLPDAEGKNELISAESKSVRSITADKSPGRKDFVSKKPNTIENRKLRKSKRIKLDPSPIPPSDFFGDDPLSIESVHQEEDSIKFNTFLESNKERFSRNSSICSSRSETQVSPPTPVRILKGLQQVSKKYGRKNKRQSHKKDIWDFSSSVPPTPSKKIKIASKIERQVRSVEPDNTKDSIISDSQLSPTPISYTNKRNNYSNAEPKFPVHKNFAAISKSKITNTPPTMEGYSSPINYEISESGSSNYSVQVKDSLVTGNNKTDSSINEKEKLIDEEIIHSDKRNETNDMSRNSKLNDIAPNDKELNNSEINERIDSNLDEGTPVLGNSTTFAELVPNDENSNTHSPKQVLDKSMTCHQSSSTNDSSMLEGTTAKTSFSQYNTSVKEFDTKNQYNLIYEGLNLLSSNLINRIKKFENDIFTKQKELHDQLESNFQQVAKNHCENLQKFNNYVTKKSDEIFKDLNE